MLKPKQDKMTGKDRVLRSLARQETDRVPFSLGFGINLPARQELAGYLGMKSLRELAVYLDSLTDIRRASPHYLGPAERNKRLENGGFIDAFGIIRQPVSHGAGFYEEISYYPLAKVTRESELADYLWPEADWWDGPVLARQIDQINQDGPYAIMLGNGNIFETTWYLRGFEQTLEDLILQPELVNAIMERVTDYYIAYFTHLLTAADGRIDLVFTADDLGGQEGLLMSLPLWENLIKPHHVRLNQVLHRYGVKIVYHTDGAIMDAVPGLIDMGIDVLEALQFDAKGMNAAILKKQYGQQLGFHGGVSVQKTLPFGTPEEVRREVFELRQVLGKGGGYILAPAHAIQAGTPPENIVAFLEAALES